MTIECTFFTSHPELPGVDEWIDRLKKTVSPIQSYGICAEFAKLVCKNGCDRDLLSAIRAARRYSKGTLTGDKFTQVIADAEISNAHGDYTGTIGMLIAAVYRGDVVETINLVVFVMCYWMDREINAAHKEITRVIERINKEVEK